jgi:hypothetical protein
MRWAGHVERRGEMRIHTEFWWENPKIQDHSEDLGVDGKIN